MKLRFKELPGTAGDFVRHVVPVAVEGMLRAPQLCLLDTGSLQNRFGAWIAHAGGVDLRGTEEDRLAVGGLVTTARVAPRSSSRLGTSHGEAPVWFCDPWPFAFNLLGQERFFRWFDVRIRAAAYEIEIRPET